MKTKSFLILVLIVLSFNSFAQEKSPWAAWSWLIGEWKGDGSGQPGQGGGTFSFQPDLDGKILIRKSKTDFPASGNRPAFNHEDLMIVSLDYSGAATKAVYFDNEGHTINYSITYSASSIVLVSEKIPNVPIFRLTYTLLEDQKVNIKFEMSQDGEKFMTYLEGKSVKVK
jgi:hypothetical protein